MNTKELSIGNALKFGFRTFFSHILTFLAIIGLFYAFVLPVQALIIQGFGPDAEIARNISALWVVLVLFSFQLGLARMLLNYYDNGVLQLKDLISPIGSILRYIAAEVLAVLVTLICTSLVGGIGLFLTQNTNNPFFVILFGIPAILIFITLLARTLFISFCIADRNVGVVDSFEQSWEITGGHTLFLIGFYVVCAIINLTVITIPATLIARAFIYRKLSPKIATPEN